MELEVTTLTSGDNFIHLCRYNEREAFVVDPNSAAQVLKALARQHLTLTAVLITHHHWDHTGGIAGLRVETACEVISPDAKRIPGTDRQVTEGDTLRFDGHEVMVIATPGHTRSSVCYYAPGHPPSIFTGDTLFIGGCGRPMECPAETLWDSLTKLAALPDETRLYCGHDYTLESYQFALTITPDSQAIQDQVRERAKDLSAPSTIGREKDTNIFLQAHTPTLQAAVSLPNAPAAQVFAELRQRKNVFG